MLVLTRKIDQKILVGNNIVITVLKIQGEQVSIGIDAPREIPIAREELIVNPEIINQIKEQNQSCLIDSDGGL